MKTHYIMPEGMRYSTLSERRRFYKEEFDIRGLGKWMKHRAIESTDYACIIGRHTGIYPKKYRNIRNNIVVFDYITSYEELRKGLVKYVPEGAYYDRNLYRDRSKCGGCRDIRRCFSCKNFLGQELAFDLDPENVVCPIHGGLSEKMRRHQGLGFCMYEFGVAEEKTAEICDLLSKRYSNLRVVYSGRGFHVHVMDEEAFLMSYADRRKLARSLISAGFPIDEWVSTGEMRLIRLPYSLHAMVSRKCTPLEIREVPGFDPVENKKTKPRFISWP